MNELSPATRAFLEDACAADPLPTEAALESACQGVLVRIGAASLEASCGVGQPPPPAAPSGLPPASPGLASHAMALVKVSVFAIVTGVSAATTHHLLRSPPRTVAPSMGTATAWVAASASPSAASPTAQGAPLSVAPSVEPSKPTIVPAPSRAAEAAETRPHKPVARSRVERGGARKTPAASATTADPRAALAEQNRVLDSAREHRKIGRPQTALSLLEEQEGLFSNSPLREAFEMERVRALFEARRAGDACQRAGALIRGPHSRIYEENARAMCPGLPAQAPDATGAEAPRP